MNQAFSSKTKFKVFHLIWKTAFEIKNKKGGKKLINVLLFAHLLESQPRCKTHCKEHHQLDLSIEAKDKINLNYWVVVGKIR